MKRFSFSILISLFLVGITLGVLGYCWYWKIQLGSMRYFDVDELAYLWWASHMHQGIMPYRDFFFFATPGFLWFLSPIFSFVGGTGPYIVARSSMLVVFFFLSIISGMVFWEMRKTWIAILVPLFLIVLPLPSDKFIEIRPDTLAILLFFIGMYVQLRVMNKQKTTNSSVSLFFIGVLYALSVVVFQKTVLFVGVAAVCFVGWVWMKQKQKLMSKKAVQTALLAGIVGGGIVGCITVAWLLTIGSTALVWYSLTKLPFEASKLGTMFPIPPSFFFFPSDIVYGIGGYHLGYWMNLVLWVVGIGIGVVRFMTPVVPHGKDGMWQEMLMSGCFFLSIFFFLWMTPFKHPQYLIPTAVFVCFYVTDGIWIAWSQMRKTVFQQVVFAIGCSLLFYFFVIGYNLVTKPKLWWRNDATIQTAAKIFKTIPTTEAILDLEGSTLYYPAPYYLSCLPIGQIVPLISLQLPSLSKELERTHTKFIFQGGSKRLQTLSQEDQIYISTHFVPVEDGTLLVRSDEAFSYVKILSK